MKETQQFQGFISSDMKQHLSVQNTTEELISLRQPLGKAIKTVRLCHMDQLRTDAVLRDLGKNPMNYILKLTVRNCMCFWLSSGNGFVRLVLLLCLSEPVGRFLSHQHAEG